MVAGIFMIFSLALSTFLLFDHLSTYNDPEVMKQNKTTNPALFHIFVSFGFFVCSLVAC
jgi:hypothetical protein